MANVKISELTQVETLSTTDVLPIVNDGETKKVTVQQIVDSVPISSRTPVLLTTITPTEAVASISYTIPNYATDKWKKIWISGKIKSNATSSVSHRLLVGGASQSISSVNGSFFNNLTNLSSTMEIMPNKKIIVDIVASPFDYVSGTFGEGVGRKLYDVDYIRNIFIKFDTPANTMIDVGTDLEIWGLE